MTPTGSAAKLIQSLQAYIRPYIEQAWALIRAHFLLRWTLANMLGWSVGLYAGSGLAASLGDIGAVSALALLPGGALAGAVAGGVQSLALTQPPDALPADLPTDLSRRWIIYSALGGTLGAIPVFFTAFALIGGAGLGFAVMGGAYGAVFGWVQTYALQNKLRDFVVIWLPVNAVGGCLCGALALGITPLNLPVFCSIGPVIFGLLTGLAWQAALRMEIGD